jgi:TolB-like protein
MDNDSTPDPPKPSGLSAFWQELKRRHVVRVGTVYAVVAWLIIQIASTTFSGFGIPDWAFRFVVLMVLLGFPVSLIIAWAFELTPEGIKTTKVAQQEKKDSPTTEKFTNKRKWLTLAFGAAIPTLIFGTLAMVFFFQAKPEQESLPSASSQLPSSNADKSIAVLPLANMSPDPENAFFADGVHEDVLTNLSRIKELLVIGRTSTLQYRDTVKTLQQIGEELGVRHLVEGSVRRAGDQVLVTVQLIDSQTGGHLWAESYNRKLDDIFAIQAAIAKEIAGKLRTILSPEEIELIDHIPTENQKAYDLFLKHRQLTHTTGGSWDKKIELLEQAVNLDPEFAEAWAFLSVEYLFSGRDDPEIVAKSRNALQIAQRLDPNNALIPWAQSFYEDLVNQDGEEKINLLLKTLAMDPGFTLAKRPLGREYFLLGRLVEAQQLFEEYNRSEPFDEIVEQLLIRVYEERGLWEQARDLSTKRYKRTGDRRMLIEMEYLSSGDKRAFIESMEGLPGFLDDAYGKVWSSLQKRNLEQARMLFEIWDNLGFRFFSSGYDLRFEPVNLMIGLIHFELGAKEDSMLAAQKAKDFLINSLAGTEYDAADEWASLAICYALLGDSEEMNKAIEQARKVVLTARRSYRDHAKSEVQIAVSQLVLGDHDQALSTLEAASKLDSPIFLNRELQLWFIFDRLRGNPRFDKLVED